MTVRKNDPIEPSKRFEQYDGLSVPLDTYTDGVEIRSKPIYQLPRLKKVEIKLQFKIFLWLIC